MFGSGAGRDRINSLVLVIISSVYDHHAISDMSQKPE